MKYLVKQHVRNVKIAEYEGTSKIQHIVSANGTVNESLESMPPCSDPT